MGLVRSMPKDRCSQAGRRQEDLFFQPAPRTNSKSAAAALRYLKQPPSVGAEATIKGAGWGEFRSAGRMPQRFLELKQRHDNSFFSHRGSAAAVTRADFDAGAPIDFGPMINCKFAT